ncbi:MAG: 50S ribosome-binding GTPase, partial [Cytophagales bacterium]
GMRGPGESELETDRRIIKEKIFKLRKKLDSIGRQNSLCFKSKKKIVNVSIIGYANVGKSTLMDLISKSNAYKENMFFSTIDSTSRKVVLHSIPFLLNDTVGFIRNLPKSLFNCFKSTLSEIKNSDILIHIVDLSNSLCDEYIDVVLKTLNLVGIFNISIILLFNKIDLILDKKHHFINSFNTLNKNIYLKNLKINYLYNNYNHDVLFISSEINYNIFYLKELLYKKIIYEYKNKGYVNF